MKSMQKYGLLTLAGAAFVIATLTPAAVAQVGNPSLSFSLDQVPGIIKPEIGQGTLKATFTYQLPSNIQPQLSTLSSFEQVTVTFDCGAQSNNIHISGPTTVLIPVKGGSQQTSFPQSATYTVTVTRDAPGLKLLRCTVGATGSPLISQGSAVPAPTAPGAQTFDVQSDYFPLIQANVDTKILEGAPQKSVPFQIHLDNLGNAQTTVSFALGDPKPDSRWKTVLPDQVTLDSPKEGTGTTSAVRNFEVSTPFKNGWNNEDQSFTLIMTPTATIDSTKGGLPISVSVLARDRGIYVPGFEPGLMLMAVLGVALLVRLKKLDQ
jgi:hypothetical protein